MAPAAIIDQFEIELLQQRRNHNISLLQREVPPNAYPNAISKWLEEREKVRTLLDKKW